MYSNQTRDYIDCVMKEVDEARQEPEFSDMLKKRELRTIRSFHNDREVLQVFAHLIAYSQNAKAASVTYMLNNNYLETAFNNFDISHVCTINPLSVESRYWDKIKAIRFKKKIHGIIGCAKSLASIEVKYGSFGNLLSQTNIPPKIQSVIDIDKFWYGFDKLIQLLKQERMPFFSHTTSLLHFLLSCGYDCVKPDIIVMRVAKNGNMVLSESGDDNRREVVKQIQHYCIERQTKPRVIDLYFLVYGGQTGVTHLVKPWFKTLDKSA